MTHALLPAFVLAGRLDVVETIGAVIEELVDGPGGVRPAAARRGVPDTTVRGWFRRFARRSGELSVAFAALVVELGAEAIAPLADGCRYALAAMRSAFEAASGLVGWGLLGRWRFVSAVSGGGMLSTNTNSPYLVVGRRRFMPPVP